MAKRRMFSLDIVNTDDFMDLPCSAQALYFHLGMQADDDGFIPNPKRVFQNIGAKASDLKKLAERDYVVLFDSGVCMIRDWKTNNFVRKDRYTPTRYQREKDSLPNGIPDDIPDGIPDDIPHNTRPVDPGKVRSGKDRSGKDRSGKVRSGKNEGEAPVPSPAADANDAKADAQDAASIPLPQCCGTEAPPFRQGGHARPRFVPPKLEEVKAYCLQRRNGIDPEGFLDFYTANGWTQGKGKPIRDWQAAVRTWERREKDGRHDHGAGRNNPPIAGITRF